MEQKSDRKFGIQLDLIATNGKRPMHLNSQPILHLNRILLTHIAIAYAENECMYFRACRTAAEHLRQTRQPHQRQI